MDEKRLDGQLGMHCPSAAGDAFPFCCWGCITTARHGSGGVIDHAAVSIGTSRMEAPRRTGGFAAGSHCESYVFPFPMSTFWRTSRRAATGWCAHPSLSLSRLPESGRGAAAGRESSGRMPLWFRNLVRRLTKCRVRTVAHQKRTRSEHNVQATAQAAVKCTRARTSPQSRHPDAAGPPAPLAPPPASFSPPSPALPPPPPPGRPPPCPVAPAAPRASPAVPAALAAPPPPAAPAPRAAPVPPVALPPPPPPPLPPMPLPRLSRSCRPRSRSSRFCSSRRSMSAVRSLAFIGMASFFRRISEMTRQRATTR